MLKTRVMTAAVLLAVLLAALFFLPTLGWLVFCALICALAAWEWAGLAGWGGKARAVYGVVLGCLCFVPVFLQMDFLRMPAVAVSPGMGFSVLFNLLFFLFLFAVLFWLLVVPFWLWRKWILRSWIAAFVGIIVLIPPTLVFISLRDRGPLLLLAVCALVWVADIAAYFSGRAFGGKKLAPNISPGKTWAGAVGAVIGVLVYCNVLLWFVPGKIEIQHLLWFQLIFVILAAWSIIGDLFESLLKRQAGIKDSSNLLPGHGGILDRIDSLTSTLTLVAFIFVLAGLILFRNLD